MQVNQDALHRAGWYYIRDKWTAPAIEFSRSNLENEQYGRIYWAKHFMAPNGLDYDVEAFSKWFDKVVRWVRKHGKRPINSAYKPYFLPDAWSQKQREPS
jgi:hypothetical protein